MTLLAVFIRFSNQPIFNNVQEDQCLESDYVCLDRHGDSCQCSNFLDVDWLSSSGNSCEEDIYERCPQGFKSVFIKLATENSSPAGRIKYINLFLDVYRSSITGLSLDGVNRLKVQLTRSGSKAGSSMKVSAVFLLLNIDCRSTLNVL